MYESIQLSLFAVKATHSEESSEFKGMGEPKIPRSVNSVKVCTIGDENL